MGLVDLAVLIRVGTALSGDAPCADVVDFPWPKEEMGGQFIEHFYFIQPNKRPREVNH
jgi:hypothetical protein